MASGSCSTQPGRGKAISIGTEALATILPSTIDNDRLGIRRSLIDRQEKISRHNLSDEECLSASADS